MKTKAAAKRKADGDVIIALLRAAFRRRLKEAGFSALEIRQIFKARAAAEEEAAHAWLSKMRKGGR